MKRSKEQAAPELTAEGPETATVTNLYLKGGWMNPRLVSGLVDGRSVRIRVKDRGLFAPGMQVHVKRADEGVYEATETPLFRRAGR
jgi:hypothetical protein